MGVVAHPDDVPVVTMSLDAAPDLSPFEAFFISRIDGRSDVDSVGKSAGLGPVEVQAVLSVLVDRKCVRLQPPAGVLHRVPPTASVVSTSVVIAGPDPAIQPFG